MVKAAVEQARGMKVCRFSLQAGDDGEERMSRGHWESGGYKDWERCSWMIGTKC